MQNLILKTLVLMGVIGGSCFVVWKAHLSLKNPPIAASPNDFTDLDSKETESQDDEIVGDLFDEVDFGFSKMTKPRSEAEHSHPASTPPATVVDSSTPPTSPMEESENPPPTSPFPATAVATDSPEPTPETPFHYDFANATPVDPEPIHPADQAPSQFEPAGHSPFTQHALMDQQEEIADQEQLLPPQGESFAPEETDRPFAFETAAIAPEGRRVENGEEYHKEPDNGSATDSQSEIYEGAEFRSLSSVENVNPLRYFSPGGKSPESNRLTDASSQQPKEEELAGDREAHPIEDALAKPNPRSEPTSLAEANSLTDREAGSESDVLPELDAAPIQEVNPNTHSAKLTQEAITLQNGFGPAAEQARSGTSFGSAHKEDSSSPTLPVRELPIPLFPQSIESPPAQVSSNRDTAHSDVHPLQAANDPFGGNAPVSNPPSAELPKSPYDNESGSPAPELTPASRSAEPELLPVPSQNIPEIQSSPSPVFPDLPIPEPLSARPEGPNPFEAYQAKAIPLTPVPPEEAGFHAAPNSASTPSVEPDPFSSGKVAQASGEQRLPGGSPLDSIPVPVSLLPPSEAVLPGQPREDHREAVMPVVPDEFNDPFGGSSPPDQTNGNSLPSPSRIERQEPSGRGIDQLKPMPGQSETGFGQGADRASVMPSDSPLPRISPAGQFSGASQRQSGPDSANLPQIHPSNREFGNFGERPAPSQTTTPIQRPELNPFPADETSVREAAQPTNWPTANSGNAPVAPELNFNQQEQQPQEALPELSSAPEEKFGLEPEIQIDRPTAREQNSSVLRGEGTVDRSIPSGPQSPELTIEKRAPKKATIGEELIYSIVIKNVGGSTARSLVVEDRIPKGTELIGTIPQAVLTDGVLSWPREELLPNEEWEVILKVIPLEAGEIGSVATVSFESSVSHMIEVTAPKIELVMNGPAEAVVGTNIPFRMTLRNVGNGDAKDVDLRTILAEQFHHPQGRDIMYHVGTLAAGQSRNIELEVTAEKPGNSTPKTIVSVNGKEHVDAFCDVKVLESRLRISTAGPKRGFVGRTLTFTTELSNVSSQQLTNITLVQQIPHGVNLAKQMPGWNPQTKMLTRSIARIAPGESKVFQDSLIPEKSGNPSFHLTARDDAGNAVEVDAPLSIKGFADLDVDITGVTRTAVVGEQLSFRLNLRNEGTAAAEVVQASFEIPAGLTFASAEGPSQFQVNGNQVTFAPISQLQIGTEEAYNIVLTASEECNTKLQVELNSADYSEPIRLAEPVRVISVSE